jgi:hypothetical protein
MTINPARNMTKLNTPAKRGRVRKNVMSRSLLSVLYHATA